MSCFNVTIASVSRFCQRVFSRFQGSQDGNVAVIFGIAVIPILALVGGAIDYSKATDVKSDLQGALDSTALAVAAATNLITDERIELGKKMFAGNWSVTGLGTTPQISISIDHDDMTGEDTVTASGSTLVETTLLKVLHFNHFTVGATSVATTLLATPICLLALNRKVPKAINIDGGAELEAVGCAVHSNSTDDTALYASGTSDANADQFCSVGGHKGNNFTPKPKRCGYAEDPYKDLEEPFVGGCDYNNTRIKKQDGPQTLSPGVYCGGIDVQTQAKVTFDEGLYIIKNGALTFSSGSKVEGDGVTFYFTGTNTLFTVISSATVDLTAPTDGPYEGFLFIQDPNSNPGQFTGQQNEIQGGGSIHLVGTIYLPTWPITISGNGNFGINSPMMPIIADTVNLTGNGLKTIQIDQTAANMWTDLPRANDGAYLVK